MKRETLNKMIENYKILKEISCKLENPGVFNIVVSEEEFIENVKKIDLLYKDFWESEIEKELLKETKFSQTFTFSENIKSEKVYLKDIIGVTHPNYSYLPWIIALPLLKRFDKNFPKNEEEKEELFNKMQNNSFDEKLKLVKDYGKYYIYEGHNRIIICKCLGLEYLKADIL